ncbi:MAG TPA: hypothetical protein VFV79_00510, partial [Saprospiraceae bacterium]|nr:hypothetical protein [Saprospiraceae bacterium]
MFTRIHYLTTSLFLLSVLSIAQPVGVWDQVPEDKKNIIETICLYPADQRHDVLIAAAHPEIIVRMGNIRTNTEFQFKDKMSGISEEDQKRIYNLTRYTDLMNAIGSHRQPRTNEEMKELLKDFPEEIHEDAIFINLHYFNTIVDINQLYRQANQDFQKLLAAYPEDLRKVYMKLSGLPEIVSLLSTNLDVTVIIGDEYRTHPEHLIKELDSLSVVVAEARAQDLNNWKTELESNPEALKEYQASANEFAARDKEYTDDVYDGNVQETQDQDVNVHVNWTYYYPYWFGWPWWYGYECWYPYPWWYHWGFYYGPQHSMIIWGFPSDFYMYWYFWYDPHLYHYP